MPSNRRLQTVTFEALPHKSCAGDDNAQILETLAADEGIKGRERTTEVLSSRGHKELPVTDVSSVVKVRLTSRG